MNGNGSAKTLKIEGRIVGAEVEALSQAASVAAGEASRLILDMSSVTFIDRSGVELLQGLCARGVELKECSPFIETLLNGESR